MNEKMSKYCKLRALGLEPQNAVIQAGYSPNNAGVRAAQLESRIDVREKVAELQRNPENDTRDAERDDEMLLKDRYDSPLDMFLDVMNNPRVPFAVRMQAGEKALPYCHGKVSEGGKKQAEKDRANAANGTPGVAKYGTRRGPGRPPSRVN